VDTFHVADAFVVPPGPVMRLGALVCPLYQLGAPVPLTGAFVRIWNGRPDLGGFPVAGDMFTNRLAATRFIGAFRVGPNQLDASRPLQEADIDLTWAPPLPPGEYWIELGLRGQPGPQGPFVPPTVWRTTQDRAMVVNAQTGQWFAAFDQQSQRQVSMPFRVIASSNQIQQCYANCDQSVTPPVLNVQDFGCFLNRFAAGDPWANCDGSTTPPVLNVGDFGCFLNQYAAGCQ
jgi:hypothetical protein